MPEITPAILGMGTAIVWFAVSIPVHLLVLHLEATSNSAKSLITSFGCSFIGIAVVIHFVSDHVGMSIVQKVLSISLGEMTIACLFVLYSPLFFVVTNSLSVQSLVLLMRYKGSASKVLLYQRFASDGLLEARLRILVRGGYVAVDGTQFYLRQRGRSLIAPFVALKTLWRLGPGG